MATYEYVPKFNYQDIETTTLDVGRIYHTPVGNMPGLTTMLSATKNVDHLNAWRDRIGHTKADKITNDASDKGTRVHDLMETLLKGDSCDKQLANANDNVIAGFNSLKIFLEGITSVWGLEIALFDEELQIAGRTDVIGCWNHRPAIIDWKTSRRPKKAEWIVDYKLQLLYYAIAHNSMFNTNITYGVILIAVENDLPQKFEVDFEKEDWLWVELANRIQTYQDSGAPQKLLQHIEELI